ncbi:MAG: phosphonate ABC transporter ATP-binding protein [Desulfobacterales bacterium]|nr:phosphonate ABC transporter ATP-binding protein [Deltaproteobacteria bacterium]NNK96310.1 phosphonate ABC transporter ATP-binding protein [Desulfobacterales bacterium]
MFIIKGLSKKYQGGVTALEEINLEILKPQVVMVIGSSGAGKSTLIRCINRLIEPTTGSVKLNDIEITTLGKTGLRRVRRRMGMIFQEYNLVDRLTVMENVLSGRLGYVNFWQAYRRKYSPEDVSAAYELLDRVGLMDNCNSRADALSGGQRQRVGIARALMQRPDLLLVDEPTASLDPKTSRQIMRLIVELAIERGTPALINIHDVALARSFADRIIGLAGGTVAFDGTSAEVSDRVLTKIYGEEDWSATIKKDDNDRDGDENLLSRIDKESSAG